MNRKIYFLPLIISAVLIAPLFAFGAPLPHSESAKEPDIVRTHPISWPGQTRASSPTAAPMQSASMAPAAAQSTLGPNLVQNPSLEVADTSGLPSHWKKGGYGTNTRTLVYPVVGSGGSNTKAVSASISAYTSGDAKWFPDEIAVIPGHTYQFSDSYKADIASIVEIRFALAGGTFSYKDIATPAASAAFATVSGQFTAPANAVSITIFHLIQSNGSLTTDDYSVREVTPQQSNNLVANGDFETAGSNGLPANWIKGGYGSNIRTFAYPTAGSAGNGAQITVSGYTSGDAKWAFDPVSLSPGSYVYTDSYISNVPTLLTAQFTRADGSSSYTDLKTLPAASIWTTGSANFVMPTGATSMRIFHLIKSNGTLTLDNVSITAASTAQNGIFATGAVSFRFDDNFANQYTDAAPILDAAGFKGTFYVVSKQVADTGFSGYMSVAQVKDLYSRGDEIGAHTRTHAHLPTLTAAQQQNEIAGSRQDIQGWSVGPVLSFAYPFGEYDATTTQIVANAGFSSAASTIRGYITPSSDHYQLEYQEWKNTTTLAEAQQWVDTALQTHTWLILTFHSIKDDPSDVYAISPSNFQALVSYVKQKSALVVTVSEGMQSM